jgi:hypothetical protein
MANTYNLIASSVLSSTTATITFSSIPTTYTDLVLRVSARSGGTTGVNFAFLFNNDTYGGQNLYSQTSLDTTSSAVASSVGTGSSAWNALINLSTTTANTFSSTEIYIPSYNSTGVKPAYTFTTIEGNITTPVYMAQYAHSYRGTSGITRVDFTGVTGNFVSGSSFYLYGIKNA